MSQLRYWVWLTTKTGLRPLALRRLREHLGTPMEIYFAPFGSYADISELTDRERSLLEDKDLGRTEEILRTCQEKGIRILTMQDADYPERLRQIGDPPPVLYVRGRLPFLDELPAIALVGTRRASAYGVKMAMKLGSEITAGGGCVVTGLALGVDAAGARGALSAGGSCVGVLGSAIDVDYPAANAGLIADVAATGAVISEFPPGYPTMAENFPRRNRIISGLSCGACIVEAPEKSGALITANLALEQGRDLFIVPGNADSPASAGSNALLRECGHAVSSGWDILSEYEGQYGGLKCVKAGAFSRPKTEEIRPSAAKSEIDKPPVLSYSDLESRIAAFPEEQQKLLRCLAKGESHVDALIAETGLSPARVLADMTILTIRGAVRALPGKHYILNFK